MAYDPAAVAQIMDSASTSGPTGQPISHKSPEWVFLRYLNRADAMTGSGYAPAASIDTAMRGACRLRFGPMELRALHDHDAVDQWSTRLHAEVASRVHPDETPAQRPSREGRIDPESIRSVGIVGTGTMASGIALTYLAAGITVSIASRSAESTTKCDAAIDLALSRQRSVAATRAAMKERLHIQHGLEHLSSCDLVIECIAETIDAKSAVFAEIDRLCPDATVLATTTSSLRVSDIAAATTAPTRVVGMHFFNPAQTMPLIELVATPNTSLSAIAISESAATLAGKEVVHCGDRPGFIVNALLVPYLNDALTVLRATRDPIGLDKTMRDFGFPMGPVALLELIGLDVALAIQNSLQAAFPEYESAPDPLLTELVDNGVLGRKNRTTIADYLSTHESTTHESG